MAKRIYNKVIPKSNDWAIVQLSRNRKEFNQKVIDQTLQVLNNDKERVRPMRDEILVTCNRELLRIKRNKWKIDPLDDTFFWQNVKKKIEESSSLPLEVQEKIDREIQESIIKRYVNEISGDFQNSHYQFAKRVATFGFARLLNAVRVKGFFSLFSKQLDLGDKIIVSGEVESLRELSTMGTIVMVPTHFSNLDSALIGWVIQYLGLPPFIYGAGLNLFNMKIFAYFMNSLGAFKVDRRKKNIHYLEALKMYSKEIIKYGCHNLFFPGGTRSRSGAIEENLKLGLLSTTLIAQRELIEESLSSDQKPRKIFIVPVVINYHFVLEAPTLIKEYLSQHAKESFYKEEDEFSTSYKILKFILKFFTKGSDISVNICKPIDVFGNYIDKQGNSIDKQGNTIDIKDYFLFQKEMIFNAQRENQYALLLSKKIVQEYHKNNTIFSSHLVAFLAYEIIKKRNQNLDVYDLLRLNEDDLVIEYDFFREKIISLLQHIMSTNNEIQYSDYLKKTPDDIINHGIYNCGLYHINRPVLKNKQGNITTQDMSLLYYYHNRMKGYEMEQYV
ncbi:MAG: 1-acyl-sn-glycerol-3-phosphate acyltransferase [Chitinophagaceae bacterium]|nr:1-acyl-sn-glycerol-3-phosphate acyltransferase [Chitinophagaceae bacterium]